MIESPHVAAAVWEQAAKCGACGSLKWRPAGAICQRRYVACADCAVERLFDRVAEQRLDLLYGRGYYPAADLLPAELAQQLENPTFAHRRARLEACLPPREKKILEIGCGDGNFLAVLRRHGWDVHGQEFSPDAAALVLRRHGVPVFAGDLANMSAERLFPVVAAYHVFEHVYHPARWLHRVAQFIEPGGLLHLQVPNGAALTRSLTRQAWAGFVFPQHVYFYTPKTLSTLLEQSGFTPLTATTWDPWHGPGTVARSVTNVVNRMCTGRLPWTDKLGDHHSQPAAAAAPIRRHPAKAAARSLLELASGSAARLEAVVGCGAVVDIIARRNDRR